MTDAVGKTQFWGFLMGAYSDRFWAIAVWVLTKKLFAALTKQLLDGKQNAVANVIIYSVDLLIFVLFRPFRDNVVNLSQILAASSNILGVVIAALPIMLPEHMIPSWVSGPIVVFITGIRYVVFFRFLLIAVVVSLCFCFSRPCLSRLFSEASCRLITRMVVISLVLALRSSQPQVQPSWVLLLLLIRCSVFLGLL